MSTHAVPDPRAVGARPILWWPWASRLGRPLSFAIAVSLAMGLAWVAPSQAAAATTEDCVRSATSPTQWGYQLLRGSAWGDGSGGTGVDVCSNGNGRTDQSGIYGPKYECAELVTRFYSKRFGYPKRWNVPTAGSIWTTHPADFKAVKNGDAPGPRWGDVMVWGGDSTNPFGHAAIVWKIEKDSKGELGLGKEQRWLYVVEQNAKFVDQSGRLYVEPGYNAFPLNGNTVSFTTDYWHQKDQPSFLGARGVFRGWLHSERTENARLSGLAALATADGKVALSWTTRSDGDPNKLAYTFYIERTYSATGVWSVVAKTGPFVTSAGTTYTYVDPDIVPGAALGYRVRAKNKWRYGGYSNEDWILGPSSPATAPSPPVDFERAQEVAKTTADAWNLVCSVATCEGWSNTWLQEAYTVISRVETILSLVEALLLVPPLVHDMDVAHAALKEYPPSSPQVRGAILAVCRDGQALHRALNGAVSGLPLVDPVPDCALGTVTPSDTTSPKVLSFSVTPSSVVAGGSFTMSYSVRDSGGSGLNRVELWRRPDGGSWVEVKHNAASGSSASGQFTDAPSAAGAYEYGVHAVNNKGDFGVEPATVHVTVTAPASVHHYFHVTTKVNVRAGPGTNYADVGDIADGTTIDIKCQALGTTVLGTTAVWDQLVSPFAGRWVSDYYVDTPSRTTFSSGIPRC